MCVWEGGTVCGVVGIDDSPENAVLVDPHPGGAAAKDQAVKQEGVATRTADVAPFTGIGGMQETVLAGPGARGGDGVAVGMGPNTTDGWRQQVGRDVGAEEAEGISALSRCGGRRRRRGGAQRRRGALRCCCSG